MTNKMKDNIIQAYCGKVDCLENDNCECLIEHLCDRCIGDFINNPTELDEAYEILMNQPTPKEDSINHPSHYNREGAMESIKEMELIFGKEAVKHFCLCNVWKYRYRAADKNGTEDLKKSDWYMKKYQELCSNE